MDLISLFFLFLFISFIGGVLFTIFAFVTGIGLQTVYAIYYWIFRKKKNQDRGMNASYSIKQGKEIK